MDPNAQYGNDHDLLIRIDTRLGTVEDELRLLRDGTQREVEILKKDKMDRNEFIEWKAEHQRDNDRIEGNLDDRLKAVEKKADRSINFVAAVGGAMTILQFVVPLILHYYFHAL